MRGGAYLTFFLFTCMCECVCAQAHVCYVLRCFTHVYMGLGTCVCKRMRVLDPFFPTQHTHHGDCSDGVNHQQRNRRQEQAWEGNQQHSPCQPSMVVCTNGPKYRSCQDSMQTIEAAQPRERHSRSASTQFATLPVTHIHAHAQRKHAET